ncbi:hypothetical protein GTA28_29015 [Rhodococcus hoagii]|nr:hypothetical protein [Prescottella equi]
MSDWRCRGGFCGLAKTSGLGYGVGEPGDAGGDRAFDPGDVLTLSTRYAPGRFGVDDSGSDNVDICCSPDALFEHRAS